MKNIFILGAMALTLAACDQADTNKETTVAQPNTTLSPDNTGVNVRDRSNVALTAGDQAENPADREISMLIRKAIQEDRALSANAKNIKIITINGIVTLRGPVNTADEKSKVEAKAKAVENVKAVINQLEIIPSR